MYYRTYFEDISSIDIIKQKRKIVSNHISIARKMIEIYIQLFQLKFNNCNGIHLTIVSKLVMYNKMIYLKLLVT